MKKENYIFTKVSSAFALILFFLMSQNSFAQCDLACNNGVQVSLDNTCSVTITPDMVLEGDPDPSCNYVIAVLDAGNNPIATSPMVTGDNIGQTLTVSVTDMTPGSPTFGNSCWGEITVEDKLAPVLNCPDDLVVLCYETPTPFSTSFIAANNMTDNCGDASVIMVSDVTTDIGCNAIAFGEADYLTDGPAVGTVDLSVSSCDFLTSNFPSLTPAVLMNIPYSIETVTITDGGLYSYVPQENAACNYIFNLYPVGAFDPADPCNVSQLLAFGGYSAINNYTQVGSALLQAGTYELVICSFDNFACVDAIRQSNSGYSAQREICYLAEDASGNLSNQCCYTINYARVSLFDAAGELNIILPPNYDNSDRDALSCNSYSCDETSNNYPGTSVTGVPTNMAGGPIFPNTSYCELNATFSDQVIPLCGPNCKIIRNWKILDWCTGQIRDYPQIIKIEQGPITLSTQENHYMVSTNDPYSCTGNFTLPFSDFNVAGLCAGTDYTYEVFALQSGITPTDVTGDGQITGADCPGQFPGIFTQQGGTFQPGQSATITGLGLGCNWVKYVFTTECGDVRDISVEVLVTDGIAPTPVCDAHTTVTLGNNGWSHVFAETFDDESHDACSDVTFGVRRMDNNCSNATFGNPPVYGSYGGNTYYTYEQFCCADIGSTVMVQLVVVDASGNWNVCMVEVEVQDKSLVTVTCPASQVTMTRACGASVPATSGPTFTNQICSTYAVRSLPDNIIPDGDCGDYNVQRSWEVYNVNTGDVIRTCNQNIRVNTTPSFGGNFIWPADVEINDMDCPDQNLSPAITGEPRPINPGNCSFIADTYSDQVFNFVDGVCFKVLRTWTVIDWCQYDSNNPTPNVDPGIWQYVQVIKINDNSAPNPVAENVSFGITADCSVGGTVSVDGGDDCGTLSYSYSIDGGNFVSTGSNNFFFNTWTIGTYTVTWNVEDACGNAGSTTQTVTVTDDKDPTPYCKSSITTVLMETTGTVAIWANDYDLGSEDNCPGNLTFSFNEAGTQPGLTFDCDDLGVQTLQMWVIDASGNADFCTVEIDIQDNSGVCGGGSRIAGVIEDEMSTKVMDVEVMLENMDTEIQLYTDTDSNGYFDFNVVTNNTDYEVSASKVDDYMNGVSTLDLVIIQKHLLEIQKLNSPYKAVAADINNSGNISALDLIELRKLILGVYDELPNNESWRFVDETQTFADVNNPWPVNEVISIAQFMDDDMDNDFVAVKIGDVNNNASTNFDGNNVSNRSDKALMLNANYPSANTGDDIRIDISSSNYEDMIGLQATFNYDAAVAEFISIESGMLEMTAANANVTQAGKIAMSWNNNTSDTYTQDDVLFTIVLRAKTNYNVSNLLTISSDVTRAEAYTNSLETINIELRNNGQITEEAFTVNQNTPNPFTDKTAISFNLPENASVSLTVFDVTGRIIKEVTQDFEKGFNTVTLDAEELNATGVMYYRIDAGSHTATRKMISL